MWYLSLNITSDIKGKLTVVGQGYLIPSDIMGSVRKIGKVEKLG